ncbi:hypothetical protein [Methanospirillum purgamenti]|jgi:hypothetical protein|uniref:Uncharacterized protein n=1 Tax=Methanospirillum hungatei TaxID=2203 RepID=A0A8F5VLK7_METHU|nr:hypothetical protein [Methanospirillum hungatei]NLW74906.1 hypothetical protein [Methanomicrobiales archaeon]QXO93725.1 hypothetical protein KSK55_10160 [Methanospirillum hungatei]
MRLLHGITAIILCFIFLCLVPCAGAVETGDVGSVDNDLQSEDWDDIFSEAQSSSFSMDQIFSEELISSILGFLMALFLSIFGVSLS